MKSGRKTLSDQLWRRFKVKEETALGEIMAEWGPSLLRFAQLRLRDDTQLAEEMVQDVFLKLWLHREALDKPEAVYGWVIVSLRHQCFDYLRNLRHQRNRDALWFGACNVESHQHGVRMEEAVEGRVDCQALRLLLKELTLPYRQCLTLKIHGYQYPEIASLLHIPEGTVKSRLNYARNRMVNLAKTHNLRDSA